MRSCSPVKKRPSVDVRPKQNKVCGSPSSGVRCIMMKFAVFIGLMASCMIVTGADAQLDFIGSIKKPVAVEKSQFLGLSESDVAKLLGKTKIRSEGKTQKSFRSGISETPRLGGYVYARVNFLTFENGLVVRHEVVDRIDACVIASPRSDGEGLK